MEKDKSLDMVEEMLNNLDKDLNIAPTNKDNKLDDNTFISLDDIEEENENDNELIQICDNAGDALIHSLKNTAKVDLVYMSKISAIPIPNLINSLKGIIYQDPMKWGEAQYEGYVTADEYLSGNIYKKLLVARDANIKYYNRFIDNVAALEAIMPTEVPSDEIYTTLGSPFIPKHIIIDFINYLVSNKLSNTDKIYYDEVTRLWSVKINVNAGVSGSMFAFNRYYGTSRIYAPKLLEKTLNNQTIAIYDTLVDYDKKTKKILNKPETLNAIEKQKLLINAFNNYIESNNNIKEEIYKSFNETYGYNVVRKFNGDFLTFPNMSNRSFLYKYQRDAVARIIFNRNTLLAHDVGSGKTYVMIAAGMELKRMGLSKKNMYVVPNNILSQWREMFLNLYPHANIYIVEAKNFTPKRRRETLEIIRDNNFDAIIITYSCFDTIMLSKSILANLKSKELAEAKEVANREDNEDNYILKKHIEDLSKELDTLLIDAQDEKNSDITFDKLGITRLFIDEAHNYKNVSIPTGITNMNGIRITGSKKCNDLMDKVNYLSSLDNTGIIMATGSPISNSISDIYIFQKYLQNSELRLLNIKNFDDWIMTFAEKNEEIEVDVDTTNFRVTTRFSKFHNLKELTSILAEIADFHQVKDDDLPEFNGYRDIVIPKNYQFNDFLKEISVRVELIRTGKIKRSDDNMLKITSDGRKAALDLRLIDINKYTKTAVSKVRECSKIIKSIYDRYNDILATQLVFCDTSIPKDNFNLYDELKLNLVNLGINPLEIAYIHTYDTPKKREELFKNVNEGKIRILIGSTFKLGIGVNVQEKLIAIHHLDVPWRPADIIQREGRILRPGNTNKEIFIYRYILEGSFDAYSWQILETKQAFIAEILSNSLTEQSKEDIADSVLNYAEIKSLAVGNPLMKERIITKNNLSRLVMLKNKAIEDKQKYERELKYIPERLKILDEEINNLILDIEVYNANKIELNKDEKKELRTFIYNAVLDNVLINEERKLMEYQGFDIILPANMLMDIKHVILAKNGRYVVEIGDSELGVLIRIDNALLQFNESLIKKQDEVKELEFNIDIIKERLKKEDNFDDEILNLEAKLKKLDEELDI